MLLLAVLACGSPDPVFPDGLGPLEDNKASFPEGSDHPEELNVVTGSGDGYDWAHGRGWIHAPVADVWTTLQDPDVDVDRRRVDAWTSEDVTPDDDEVEVEYVIHHTVHDVVDVTYDLTWKHGQVEDGTVGIRWEKTDGTSLIDVYQGSIALEAEDDDVTAFEVIEHLGAPTQGADAIEQYESDLFASVVAVVHGDPLPDWSE